MVELSKGYHLRLQTVGNSITKGFIKYVYNQALQNVALESICKYLKLTA